MGALLLQLLQPLPAAVPFLLSGLQQLALTLLLLFRSSRGSQGTGWTDTTNYLYAFLVVDAALGEALLLLSCCCCCRGSSLSSNNKGDSRKRGRPVVMVLVLVLLLWSVCRALAAVHTNDASTYLFLSSSLAH